MACTGLEAQLHRCGSHEALLQKDGHFPGYVQAVNKTFDDAKASTSNKTNVVYQIRTVIHVVYDVAAKDLPDSILQSQIAVLNEDFRRMNADTSNTRSVFKPFAADAEIEFYLADTDPDGNPTTGITRTTTSTAMWGNLFDIAAMDGVKDDATGGKSPWDTDQYLNIWVADLSMPFIGDALLGYAYPPAGAPNWPAGQSAPSPDDEGVVIHYKVAGRGNPNATGVLAAVDKGRTCTHEVGHYLGLRHIWGDGGGFSGTPGCTVDDGNDDTPNAEDASAQDCDTTKNTCVDSPIDYPDMIENYMDYADEGCMNMFTNDQVAIMRSMLEGPRAGIIGLAASADKPILPSTSVSIFPNPSAGTFEFAFKNAGYQLENIKVLNLMGAQVAAFQATDLGTSRRIDLNHLTEGIYIVQMGLNSGTVNTKIMISK